MPSKTLQSEPSKNKKPAAAWRKPIILDDEADDDPLAGLYQGREAGLTELPVRTPPPKQVPPVKKEAKAAVVKTPVTAPKKVKPEVPAEKPITTPVSFRASQEEKHVVESTPVPSEKTLSGEKLRSLLRIKDETYECADIREILRGKSLELYAYLSLRAGKSGVCKIKTADLMDVLDVSRPTLFKQTDWLTKLSLISKRSIPGDHLGTSFIVRNAGDVLPVSSEVLSQIDEAIAALSQA